MYELLYLPFRLGRFVEEKAYEYRCQASARLASDARLLNGARILNARKVRDAISVGKGTIIRGELFIFGHGGQIKIGDSCYVGEDARIWSSSEITIGNRVLISHGANIHDNNSHPISAKFRSQHFSAISKTGHPSSGVEISALPVMIEDDAWIGFNSIVLKGVTIGEGAIVGAGSVVTKDVAPWTIVAGNPARVIREIPPNER